MKYITKISNLYMRKQAQRGSVTCPRPHKVNGRAGI